MRRTLRERLAGPFRPETALRTSPDHPAITLTNKGYVVARVRNLGPEARKELGHPHYTFSQDLEIEEDADGVLIRFPEGGDVPIVRILLDSDREIIERVAEGKPARGGWDTGKRFSATLSTGEIAMRVPITAPVPFDIHAHRTLRVEDAAVAILPPNAPVPEAAEEVNGPDVLRVARDAYWRTEAALADSTSFISVHGHTLRFDLPYGFETLREQILRKGATEHNGALVMDKETFIESRIHIRDLRTEHAAIQRRIVAAQRRAEAQARARFVEELGRKGIDARNDPNWVSRTMDGDAVFSVPVKAKALLSLLTASGAHKRQGTPGKAVEVWMSPDAFAKIIPVLPTISREIAAVNRGLSGDAASMERRVRSEAQKAGKEKVKAAITSARNSRSKEAVRLPAETQSIHDPMSPLNPVGILQMHLWAAEAEREGATQQARSMAATVQESDGGLCFEPAKGGSWGSHADPYANPYADGGGYSGGHSSPSSTYESSSSTSDNSPSPSNFD